jgi:hypothetical protein
LFADGSNKFRKREHDWGFQSLMELSKLHDELNGFLVEDRIVLQVSAATTLSARHGRNA